MVRVGLCAVLAVAAGCERKARPAENGRDATAVVAADAHVADAAEVVKVPAPPGPYTGPICDQRFAPRPDRDASPMCFQPGGAFLMGSPEGEGESDEHPQRRVTLSPFFIDQFEVTRAQFARFLNEADHQLACDEIGWSMCPGDTRSWASDWPLDLYQDGRRVDWTAPQFVANASRRFTVRKGDERLPMYHVTFKAARAYCRWAGKAVPSNAQWEYAARVEPLTGHLRSYPWGDRFEKARANCRNECGDPFEFDAPIDATPRDVSATGVRNLGGNVPEYAEGCHTETLEDCGACIDPVGETECRPTRQTVVVDGVTRHVTVGGWSTRGSGFLWGSEPTRGADRGGVMIFGWIGLRCVASARADED
jgi:formylglycine-generating enzyme required for sulfatase activity